MKSGARAAAAILWIFGLAGAATAQDAGDWHTHPMCWQEPRTYHGKGPSDLEDAARRQLAITRVTQALPKPFTASPNHAYAFHQIGEFTSGTSRQTLLVAVERPYLLKIEAADVFGLNDLRWVNEKLLYFRLWLGRAVGTDVIVDVEKEKVVYTEAVADGGILWQQAHDSCKAWEGTPDACQVTCYPLK